MYKESQNQWSLQFFKSIYYYLKCVRTQSLSYDLLSPRRHFIRKECHCELQKQINEDTFFLARPGFFRLSRPLWFLLFTSYSYKTITKNPSGLILAINTRVRTVSLKQLFLIWVFCFLLLLYDNLLFTFLQLYLFGQVIITDSNVLLLHRFP